MHDDREVSEKLEAFRDSVSIQRDAGADQNAQALRGAGLAARDEEAFDAFEGEIMDDVASQKRTLPCHKCEKPIDLDGPWARHDGGHFHNDCLAAVQKREAKNQKQRAEMKEEKKPRKKGAGARYVAVPAAVVRETMKKAGFVEDVFGKEIFFKRVHSQCKHITVKVFTSLPARGGDVRALGDDVIKVMAVFEKETPGRARPFVRCFYKQRVLRTAPQDMTDEERSAHVMLRAIERAREAWAASNEYCKSESRCYECCGFPPASGTDIRGRR